MKYLLLIFTVLFLFSCKKEPEKKFCWTCYIHYYYISSGTAVPVNITDTICDKSNTDINAMYSEWKYKSFDSGIYCNTPR